MFGIAGIYWVLINSVVSFFYLFLISKILGKKQIAQLEFIDYAVGISLGSIAAEWATQTEEPFYYYLIAMTFYFALAFMIALIGRKTPLLKRIFKGKPITLVYEGKIDWKVLKKTHIDVNDLLSMLREKNYFDINDVAYAIFEPSGKLSVLPKGNQRPVVIEDVNSKAIQQASITNVLINDINKDISWLFNKLKIKYKAQLKNIILATYDKKTDKIQVQKKDSI